MRNEEILHNNGNLSVTAPSELADIFTHQLMPQDRCMIINALSNAFLVGVRETLGLFNGEKFSIYTTSFCRAKIMEGKFLKEIQLIDIQIVPYKD